MEISKECIFCGTLLDEENKSQYACNDCLNKVNILKQLTKADNAREKISKATQKYLRRKYDYQEERDNVALKMLKDGFVFKSTDEMCLRCNLRKKK